MGLDVIDEHVAKEDAAIHNVRAFADLRESISAGDNEIICRNGVEFGIVEGSPIQQERGNDLLSGRFHSIESNLKAAQGKYSDRRNQPALERLLELGPGELQRNQRVLKGQHFESVSPHDFALP